MKVITYMCENCFEPYQFNPSEESDFLCPKCGEKMMYWGTEEIDLNTHKVIKRYDEIEKKQKNPGKPVIHKARIECPYCHSTNTKRITYISKVVHTSIFGIFSIGRNAKQFHCNDCNSDF